MVGTLRFAHPTSPIAYDSNLGNAVPQHVSTRSTHPKTVITGLVPVISINGARRYAKRVSKCRALSIEMAGTRPAMTIPSERNAL
jgi:hypothetical protein